jgi:hypothetical protein
MSQKHGATSFILDHHPECRKRFPSFFPGDEFIQKRRFIHLHRLIIGLEIDFIEEELVDYPQSVHALDIDGWTSLH